MSYIPWSRFRPQQGRVKAAVLAAQREPWLRQHLCPAPIMGLCPAPVSFPTGQGCAGTPALGLGDQQTLALVLLFLQLLGTEGAVGGNTTGVSWEMLQEQPDREHSSPAGQRCPCVWGRCCAELSKKRGEAAGGLSSSLPVPSRCTGQRSPSDLSAKHLTPGEGGELLPCSVSALCSVPELCSPS